jgi:alpha-methylacyl-CoA racemase
MSLPLQGVRVLDFSTLLPGPMATLILAEAGAEVIKIERPGGEELRAYAPKFGADAVNFGLLNRGKRSVAIDLKQPGAVQRLRPLIESADVVVEQFRPGVMQRLGLGYETLKGINARLIYCAITGYGQNGPRSAVAGHDLNYQAETGMLALAAGCDGAPVVPPALVADIGGGAYPAVINILLALRLREQSGEGCQIDISMSDNLFPFMYWGLGGASVTGEWPRPAGEIITGGSPRFHIYRTADDRFVAVAALEQKFWENFCALIDLPADLRNDSVNPAATTDAVAALIRGAPASHWDAEFAGKDVCCNIVKSLREAAADRHFSSRGLFERNLAAGERTIPAAPVPLSGNLRRSDATLGYPPLGEANALLGPPSD